MGTEVTQGPGAGERGERGVLAACAALALGLGFTWIFVLPFDATDLCYLLSLDDHTWAPQEVVHPLWVPTLAALRALLGVLGYHGFMLAPIEVANVVISLGTALLVYRVAHRATRDAVASAVAVLALMTATGFSSAAMRPTPYALGFACVFGAVTLIAGERPASKLRAVGAGALAGVGMALHASAMALAPAAILIAALDPEREARRTAVARATAFLAGMVTVFVAAWGAWFTWNGLDRSFFDPAHLRGLFSGVEQVPGTSIYTSHSVARQIVGLVATLSRQGGLLVPLGAVAVVVEVWQRRASAAAPADRRLLLGALLCFGGIAGFFAINNNKNGFNYAALALVPLLVARLCARLPRRRSVRLGLLAASGLSVVAGAWAAVGSNHNRLHERLPQEIAFVANALAPRGVLLVPGCRFREIDLLSSLAVVRVHAPTEPRERCDAPSLEVGPVLRARVQAWQRGGSRVWFALGDEGQDFYGDANGMEKDVQLFWRPELLAADRAPKLRAVRAAIEAQGLRLGDEIVSPRGARYAEVSLRAGEPEDTPAPPATRVTPSRTDAHARVERSEVERFHRLVPDDPWAGCDAVCSGSAGIVDEGAPSLIVACGCVIDDTPRRDVGCYFVPLDDSAAVGRYITAWAAQKQVRAPVDWSASLDGGAAAVALRFDPGAVRFSWQIAPSCGVTAAEATADAPELAAIATPAAAEDFAARFPAATTRVTYAP